VYNRHRRSAAYIEIARYTTKRLTPELTGREHTVFNIIEGNHEREAIERSG
jgi:hypothetical protein